MSFVSRAARSTQDSQTDEAVVDPGRLAGSKLTTPPPPPPGGRKRRHCWLILAILAASAGLTAITASTSAQTDTAPLDPAGCSNGTWVQDPGNNPDLVADCIALVAIRNHFKTIPENAKVDWNTPLKGVITSDERRVTGSRLEHRVAILWLRNNKLSGTIPVARLGDLTNLRGLNLAGNNLSGTIPPELGKLTNLQHLYLCGNNLSGSIPPELGKLTNLNRLELCNNNLSGTIPPELGLTNLRDLDLAGNNLTGTIPPELGKLTDLTWLRLSVNNLSGAIPPELGKLTDLTWLELSNNNLSGTIPPELSNIIRLTELDLSSNNLSGAIPPELGNNPMDDQVNVQNIRLANDGFRLQKLDLSDNDLSGAIPPELGNITNLQQLHLTGNNLSGAIPPELGKLTDLTWLELSNNNLSGAIPPELGKLTKLTYLDLSSNNLSGTIPPELGKLIKLPYLDLSDNNLSGTIPPELSNIRPVVQSSGNLLDLSNNDLSGTIPPGLGYGHLNLSNNRLSGPIPPELGDANIWQLDLSNNDLSGTIPPELNPGYKRLLNLSNNRLSGAIPPELGHTDDLTNLYWLDLSNNDLSGTIPPELFNHIRLRSLKLHCNNLSGAIPIVVVELLSLFSGGLGVLDLSNNDLSGAVPAGLLDYGFHSLSLGGNNLSGVGDYDAASPCYEGTFSDDDDSVHLANIEQLVDWGITQGCGQNRFCPSRTVTRAQMAAFLYRAVTRLYGVPDPAAEVQLTDVGADVWYRSEAQWAAANGVMRVTGGAFNPQGSVTRADMAEMLIAAFDHLTASPEFQDLFSDVAGIPYATIQAMEGIYDAGVTTGCGTNPLRYCPTKEVTRAQMASFLVRAINLASDNS